MARSKQILLPLAGLLLFSLFGIGVSCQGGEETIERRILYNNDDCNWFGILCFGETNPNRMRRLLEEEFIDRLAEAGVDALSVCLWDRFRCVGRSKIVEPLVGPEAYGFFPEWQPLYQVGMDPVTIMIDRCRQKGIDFIAGMRMNDRHDDERFPKGRFIVANPQWHLKGDQTPEGQRRQYGTRVDYAYEPVRQEVLAYVEELLNTYDVDGIEFDYMRACHMFSPGTGPANAHKLTEFTRRTRELLDLPAKRRGRRRLKLGVRVPPTLRDCHFLGFDLKTWAAEKLVDYVCLSHYVRTDLNLPVEDFVRLLQGTGCKVYPTIHPSAGFQSVPFLAQGTKLDVAGDLAVYRAAASNYYGAGADGLQTYNYQQLGENYGTRPENYAGQQFRAAMSWIRELKDPERLAGGERRFVFYPLWWPAESDPCGNLEAKTECNFSYRSPVVKLERGESTKAGSLGFRVAEELGLSGQRAELRFKAIGLRESESLTISINRFPVPKKALSRENERFEELSSAKFAFLIRGTLARQMVRGENKLEIRLVSGPAVGDGHVTIGDLEVLVQVVPSSQ